MRRLCTAALLITAGTSFGQPKATSQPGSPSTLRTTTTLVVVPTLVESPSKEIVYSLNADDFRLTDKGIPQKITLDTASSQPLSLVVLMQTGGAAIHEFDKYRNLETMLADMLSGPPNQVSIVNFDSKPEAASPFTSDIAQWRDAIDHPDPGDDGAAIMDALKFALDLLAQQPANNRRAILLISQPQDAGSKTTAREILRITAETNTAIYALTFSPQITKLKDSLKENHGNPPLTVGNASYYAYFNLSEPLAMIVGSMRKNVAAELAPLTGGEAAQFDNQHQLDDDLSALASHIRNRYILSFAPTSTEAGLHALQVRLINHPDLTVITRSSYWLTDQSSK